MLPKQVSKLDLRKYYSLYSGMWNLFCRVGHYPCIQLLLSCIRRRNPPCNAEDNCAPNSSSLKPGSGATVGVLDWGVLGQPDYILWPDYWTMKIQDSRLRPVSGWDSPWRRRQAWQYGYEDLLPCNRLCVTLAPSGVYINRRV